MSWVFLLVIAYFFISLTALADKFLLTKALPHAIVYVFYISLLSLFSLLLIPLGFNWPSLQTFVIIFLSGTAFTVGLYFLFTALQKSEASRVFATVGALSACFTFIFSFLFLDERLSGYQVLGFVLLVVGGLFVSIEYQQDKKFTETGFLYSVLTAFLFGIAYTGTKHVYDVQGFISGFIWIRVMAFFAIVFFMLIPKNRRYIRESFRSSAKIQRWGNQVILITGQASSAVGFLILNYVISLRSAAIVLAAQGLQYAFLFITGIILTKWFKHIIEEKIHKEVIWQKSFSILLIAIGLVIISYF